MKAKFAAAGLLAVAMITGFDIRRSEAQDIDKSGYTLFDPTPDDQMRPFATDRPTKSNSPYTVDAGHFQYETDAPLYTYSKQGSLSTRQWTIADPTLKLGMTNWMDAELTVAPYTHVRVTNSSAHVTQSASGFGDMVGRLKMNVFGNDGGDAALALIPYVKVPTAAENIGNGAFEGGIIAPLGLTLPGGFTLILMPEFDELKDDDGSGRHANFANLINLSHEIVDGLTGYAEFYSSVAEDHGGKPIYTADVALAYAVTQSFQLDIGANFGLSSTAPQTQLYFGVSQRF
jgi:hypothetical protein